MLHGDVLRELARQVRGSTLHVFNAVPAECLTWTPRPTSNHILWHAGHAVWLQDLLCVELLTGQSELPRGWSTYFGARSRPDAVAEWPSADDVRSRLESQRDRVLDLLAQVPDQFLQQTPHRFKDTRTHLGWIVHGLHDEAKHNGEMYLLWKLFRSREGEGKPR